MHWQAWMGLETMDEVRVLICNDDCPKLPIVEGDGSAQAMVSTGVSAGIANMNYIRMEPGEANQPHTDSSFEDTVFISEGKGSAQNFDHDRRQSFEAGQVIHVPLDLKHTVFADRVCVVSVGEPCSADCAMLQAVGALEDDN